MEGYCEDCKKRATCTKTIGIVWGFCKTDFEEDDPEETIRQDLLNTLEEMSFEDLSKAFNWTCDFEGEELHRMADLQGFLNGIEDKEWKEDLLESAIWDGFSKDNAYFRAIDNELHSSDFMDDLVDLEALRDSILVSGHDFEIPALLDFWKRANAEMDKHSMEPVHVDGVTITTGHTFEEYQYLHGFAHEAGDLWDFLVSDVQHGSVELAPGTVYWQIGNRVYEAN